MVVDLIVHNAVIHTMNDDDAAASAFAAEGGRFTIVGDDATVLALADSTTRIIDAKGAAIVPGMLDAHNHHNMAGENDLFKLNIEANASVDEICEAVADWIATHDLQGGEWITGGGWGATLLEELMLPESLAKLDAVSPRNPVLLRDDSHHQKWTNSVALDRIGITDETPDPEGGTIWRDPSGAATGLLLEGASAMAETARMLDGGQSGDEYDERCSRRGIEILNSYGVTAFQDASSTKEVLGALKRLDEAGELNAWVVSSMPIHDVFFGIDFVGRPLIEIREEYRSEHHRPDYTKIWLDGVPMNQTTALLEPYLPSEEHGHVHRGTTTMPYEELAEWISYVGEQGLGVKVHATGDASLRMVLDSVQAARDAGSDVKVQVAHATFVHPDDVPRFAELNVIAEMSPAIWSPSVLTEAIRHVVPDEAVANMYPNRALLDSGAHTVIGTDWPVPPTPNPWPAIYALVTRKDPSGGYPGELNGDQAVTIDEALRMHTSWSARALGLDDVVGRIAEGLSADFVILDADPLQVDSEDLKSIAPTETWFGGRRVYARD